MPESAIRHRHESQKIEFLKESTLPKLKKLKKRLVIDSDPDFLEKIKINAKLAKMKN